MKFGLVWLYGISTLEGKSTLYIYIKYTGFGWVGLDFMVYQPLKII